MEANQLSLKGQLDNNATIIHFIEYYAQYNPNDIAISYKQKALTYAELNHKANQLAHHIQIEYKEKYNSNLSVETLIIMCLDQSMDWLIAILGILKSGAAYIPVSPSAPDKRIQQIIADSASHVIITQNSYKKRLQDLYEKTEPVIIKMDKNAYTNRSSNNLNLVLHSSNLAYVIYTSGTTGNPKGVMVEHGTYLNFLAEFKDKYQSIINPRKINICSLTNYVFDIFGLEYGLALICGGEVILTNINDVSEFELSHSHLVQQTPSVLLQLAYRFPESLHKLVCLCGGEALTKNIAKELLKVFKILINVYGPTETTIWSMSNIVDSSENHAIIGRTLNGETIYILDEALNAVPQGVTGELYISGIGLARGYLNNHNLSIQKFIIDGCTDNGEKHRLYKTGDLVKQQEDGRILFIGRSDFQVKIRGHRIELGEIEKTLLEIESIYQVCVLINGPSENKHLFGYYATNDAHLNEDIVMEHMKKHLPDYMVPDWLFQLNEFPLTINGKIDHKALPLPQLKQQLFIPARNKIDSAILLEMKDLLGLAKPGIKTDFFEAGGNSLLALEYCRRLKNKGYQLSITDIFKYRSVESLSDFISASGMRNDNLSSVTGPGYTADAYIPYEILNKNKTATIFIFPPRNGGAESYLHNLVLHFPEKRIILFNNYYKYLKDRNINVAMSYEQLAAYYIVFIKQIQPDGPYTFLGWSFGGVVALETANQLLSTGNQLNKVFMIDSYFGMHKAIAHLKNISIIIPETDDLDHVFHLTLSRELKEHEGVYLFKCKKTLSAEAIKKNSYTSEKAYQIDLDNYYTNNAHDNHLGDIHPNIKIIPIPGSHDEWMFQYDIVKTIANAVFH